ncbi:MAG: Rrf2 family transcriptional regulator [Phycisphaera sp.]|nr:Rrf2 family transcriptional regulator [Phycisphaera sp.]
MKLTKASTQAALALAYLSSRKDEGFIQARNVAEFLDAPTDSALKILQTLARRGLLQSQLGRSGGYRFSGDPDRVSLLHVVEAIDGPIVSDIRISTGPQVDRMVTVLQSACDHAAAHIREDLNHVTIADLAGKTTRNADLLLAV